MNAQKNERDQAMLNSFNDNYLQVWFRRGFRLFIFLLASKLIFMRIKIIFDAHEN